MANILNKFLRNVYKTDSLIQEKYQGLGRDEQIAVCNPIIISGILGLLYLSSTECGLVSYIPLFTSFGTVLYLDRKNIINDISYNSLCAEINGNG